MSLIIHRETQCGPYRVQSVGNNTVLQTFPTTEELLQFVGLHFDPSFDYIERDKDAAKAEDLEEELKDSKKKVDALETELDKRQERVESLEATVLRLKQDIEELR